MSNKIIQNAVLVISANTIYKSENRHDYIGFKTNDGMEWFLDGGSDYIRTNVDCGVNKHPDMEILFLSEESSLSEILDNLLWGTRGADGKQPLTHKRIKDLDPDHLEALVTYEHWDRIPPVHQMAIKVWRIRKSLVGT